MSSNYPVGYDDNANLGGPFSNAEPPTDPALDIDATHTNNRNDSIFSIEARLGIYGEVDTTTLDWATLTVSNVPNQGLRFAGSHSSWPGDVAEDGIFIDSTTGNVSFHKGGDAVGTFYDLTSTGSSYTPPTGSDTNKLQVWDGATWSASNIVDSNTNLDAVKISQSGPGNILNLSDSSTDVWYLDNSGAVVHTMPAVSASYNGHTLSVTAGNLETANLLTGLDVEVNEGSSATGGDLIGVNIELFAGSGTIDSSTGLYIPSGWDLGFNSESPSIISVDTTSLSGQPVLDIFCQDTGSDNIGFRVNDGTPSSYSARFSVKRSGRTELTAESSNTSLYVSQNSSGGLFDFYDLLNTASRLTLTRQGLLSLVTDSNLESEALSITQNDTNMSFIDFVGTESEDKSANISSGLGSEGSVVGPLSSQWSGFRMVKLEVNGVSGWICLFT